MKKLKAALERLEHEIAIHDTSKEKLDQFAKDLITLTKFVRELLNFLGL